MYCKDCGQQISDDSKYCFHCGKPQTSPTSAENPQQIIVSQTAKKLESVFGLDISKTNIGYYSIWFLIHLIILLTNYNSESFKEPFWPFSRGFIEVQNYDLSEFLFYTIIPLFFLIILSLFKKTEEPKSETLQLKYDLNYKTSKTPTIVGIAIMAFYIILYFGNKFYTENYIYQYGYYNYENYQTKEKAILIISLFSFFMRIIVSLGVWNIAKNLNRKTIIWIISALLFPSITLIIIGQKRKLKTFGHA